MIITEQQAKEIICYMDAGLTSGLGRKGKGQGCVQAAVSAVMENYHGDQPECVLRSVRDFGVCLNDLQWSSKAARGKGLKRFALAQLGSAESASEIESAFQRITRQLILKKVAPFAIREFLKGKSWHYRAKERFLKAARILEKRPDSIGLNKATYLLDSSSVGSSLFSMALNQVTGSPAIQFTYALMGHGAFHFQPETRDKILAMTAECAVQALIKLKSPGRKFLKMTKRQIVKAGKKDRKRHEKLLAKAFRMSCKLPVHRKYPKKKAQVLHAIQSL